MRDFPAGQCQTTYWVLNYGILTKSKHYYHSMAVKFTRFKSNRTLWDELDRRMRQPQPESTSWIYWVNFDTCMNCLASQWWSYITSTEFDVVLMDAYNHMWRYFSSPINTFWQSLCQISFWYVTFFSVKFYFEVYEINLKCCVLFCRIYISIYK